MSSHTIKSINRLAGVIICVSTIRDRASRADTFLLTHLPHHKVLKVMVLDESSDRLNFLLSVDVQSPRGLLDDALHSLHRRDG